MKTMSDDICEENWLALAAAIMSPKEQSVGNILCLLNLSAPYERIGGEARRRRDAEIVERYKTGQSAYKIAKEMDIHRQTVYEALHNVGISLRKTKFEKGGSL